MCNLVKLEVETVATWKLGEEPLQDRAMGMRLVELLVLHNGRVVVAGLLSPGRGDVHNTLLDVKTQLRLLRDKVDLLIWCV